MKNSYSFTFPLVTEDVWDSLAVFLDESFPAPPDLGAGTLSSQDEGYVFQMADDGRSATCRCDMSNTLAFMVDLLFGPDSKFFA